MKKIFCTLSVLTGALLASSSLMAMDMDKEGCLKMKLKDGDVHIKLQSDIAPNHVKRVKQLTKKGLYNHVVFHRVIDGFMAQTGDVQFGEKDSKDYDLSRVGTGGSTLSDLKAEFSDVPFERRTVAMARSKDPDSANSQFFICSAKAPHLNGQYTVIGVVTKGMEYVDLIKKGDPKKNGAVTDPDAMIKMEVVDCPSS